MAQARHTATTGSGDDVYPSIVDKAAALVDPATVVEVLEGARRGEVSLSYRAALLDEQVC